MLFFLLLLLLPVLALADDLLPYCVSDHAEDGSLIPCGEYGYKATWIVKTKDVITNMDDNLNYITINDQKAPPVKINVGQRIRIVLENQMSEPITLHFHGIIQDQGYAVMDGPQGVVQSGVVEGKNFVYDFPVRQAGTFWIHSHAPGQYPKGLRAPLTVVDPNEATELGYDSTLDFTTTVSDWWPNFWAAEAKYLNGTCGNGVEAGPWNVTINDADPTEEESLRAASTYVVPQGKVARLRFINTSAFAQFYVFASDRRNLQVIELDGVRVTAQKEMQGFSIASGQRVSILFTGSDQPLRLYFVSEPRVASPSGNCIAQPRNPSLGGLAQFTQLYINNLPSTVDKPVDNQVNLEDFTSIDSKGNTDRQRWLKTWRDCNDEFSRPYYSSRLKMPMADDNRRGGRITIDGCKKPLAGGIHAPMDVFGFTDTNFQAQDGVGPWMVPEATSEFIHLISIQDHALNDAEKGRGVMGKTNATNLTPDNLFKSPESPQDVRNYQKDRPSETTLQRVLNSYWPMDVLKNPKMYNVGGESQTLVFPTVDKVHWLVLRTTRGDHPIHLHGHEFQVLARTEAGTFGNGDSMNFGSDKPEMDLKTLVQNVTNINRGKAPVRRDTIMIERGWNYVLAVRASNPGVWALHCHNDFHASTGMFMQVVEAPQELRNRLGTWMFADDAGRNIDCPNSLTVEISLRGNNSGPDSPGAQTKVWPPYAQLLQKSFEYWGYGDACFTTDINLLSVSG